jgi:type IV fimbrial biogenesis protein FimT
MELSGNSPGSKGFTIIEMLITIAVAAILLGVAVPSLQNFTANGQVVAASNSIVAGLNLARSTAVTLGERVAICHSDDESACTVDESDKDWDKGWIVFECDPDITASCVMGESRRVVTLSRGLSDSADVQVIVFEADGTTNQSSVLSIEICNDDTDVTNQCRQISVSPFGVISSSKTTATG